MEIRASQINRVCPMVCTVHKMIKIQQLFEDVESVSAVSKHIRICTPPSVSMASLRVSPTRGGLLFLLAPPEEGLGVRIFVYVCICCEVIIWAKFGFWRVIIWAKLGLLSGPSLFSHYKNRGFRRFAFAQLSFLCFFLCSIVCQFSKNSLFEKGCSKNWVFQISLF